MLVKYYPLMTNGNKPWVPISVKSKCPAIHPNRAPPNHIKIGNFENTLSRNALADE